MKSLELLAPAKDLASARAAIDYGADAVYMGASRFGARRAAGNSIEEIHQAAEYAHLFGCRLHATLNTELYDNELHDAEALARELIAAGVDALIVQDMALRRMNLPIELHASTQMSNMSVEGITFLAQCGFSRVVLERALSIDEIRNIATATDVELEAFVHGAICVGYSGRCFLSRSMSERSGNRGECCQSCRMTYDLEDDNGHTLLRNKHLLSVLDLNLSARIGSLVEAGVSSFKIEGRLKDISYIKNTVACYRTAIDDYISTHEGYRRSSEGRTIRDFEPSTLKTFTRGESEYMFSGRASGVASFDTPKAIGEYIGRVKRITPTHISLDTATTLTAGDGICWMTSDGMVGTNINRADTSGFQPNRATGLCVGTEIFRNFDHSFNLRLARSRTHRTIEARCRVEVSEKQVSLTYIDSEGIQARTQRQMPFEKTHNAEKMLRTWQEQAAKSGDTIFTIINVTVAGNEWFVPASLIGELRREALAALRQQRIVAPRSHKILPEDVSARYPAECVTGEQNVTNAVAEQFYRDHGAQSVERGLDCEPTLVGRRVMQSAYCIRREIGECLKCGSTLRGDLHLVHGNNRYRLEFDCRKCEMNLICEK